MDRASLKKELGGKTLYYIKSFTAKPAQWYGTERDIRYEKDRYRITLYFAGRRITAVGFLKSGYIVETIPDDLAREAVSSLTVKPLVLAEEEIGTITVEAPPPSFTFTLYDVSPTLLTSEEEITFKHRFKNTGGSAGHLKYSGYFEGVTPPIYQGTLQNIAVGDETSTLTDYHVPEVIMPGIAPGFYKLKAVVDVWDGPEADPLAIATSPGTDEKSVSITIIEVLSAHLNPPHTIPATAQRGRTVTFGVGVKSDVGDRSIKVYTHVHMVHSAGTPEYSADSAVTTFAANEAKTLSVSIAIPADATIGTYTVYAEVFASEVS